MKYAYFVFYKFASGFGRTELKTEKPILTFTDIKSAEKTISDSSGITGLCIVFYKRIKAEK
jgi:hypothetical protein